MKFFAPNLQRKGRVVRVVTGTALVIGGLSLSRHAFWVCIVLIAAGAFVLYEGFRGWCLMRACGIKTKW
jgi:hypothetical protein